MKLFIVGSRQGRVKHTDGRNSIAWDFEGIYQDWNEALEHCSEEHYFILPVEANQPFPVSIEEEGIFPNAITTADD